MTKDKLYEIIDSHCCSGCDGYQCPNWGAGKTTEEIVEQLIKQYGEKFNDRI
jgi:hypothetical protein